VNQGERDREKDAEIERGNSFPAFKNLLREM
jgi:hypothetical protein